MGEEKYFDEEFTSFAEKLLARYHVPSISVAVVDNGKTYSKAFGLARFPSTPATPDTLYYTGSTTKAMIAAALGVVIHNPDKIKLEPKLQDPLSWSTPLRSVLGDDFTLHDKYVGENATIEDALSHRTGFSGDDLIYGSYIGERPREITKRLRYMGPLNKPFRTAMQYNNFMYAVAGDVLETLTASTCSEALQDLLWKPLGMSRTFLHLKEVVDAPHIDRGKDLSRGYFWAEGAKDQDQSADGFYIPDSYVKFEGVAPAGAVISSVLEYTKWIQALLDAASSSKESSSSTTNPISSTLFAELTSSRITSGLPLPGNAQLASLSWGLGWNSFPSLCGPSHPMIAHSGGVPGYGTMLYILPNDSFGVVTMSNTSLSSNLIGGFLCQELMARKLDLKSSGRERDLQQFNLLMQSQFVGMEHCLPALPDDDNSEDTKAMLKNTAVSAGSKLDPTEFIHKQDQNLPDLQKLQGIYTNGAHGSYRISIVDPTPDTSNGHEKIDPDAGFQYRFPRDQSLNDTKDTIRSSCYSLKIEILGGKRSWNYGYLLHPRVSEPPKESESTNTNTTNNPSPTTTRFDQEWLAGHGPAKTDDLIPGLPSGIDGEDGDGTGKCRGLSYWESMIWTRHGAAFVRDSDTGKLKMGMTLGNSMYVVDGTTGKGWEETKVWFERE